MAIGMLEAWMLAPAVARRLNVHEYNKPPQKQIPRDKQAHVIGPELAAMRHHPSTAQPYPVTSST